MIFEYSSMSKWFAKMQYPFFVWKLSMVCRALYEISDVPCTWVKVFVYLRTMSWIRIQIPDWFDCLGSGSVLGMRTRTQKHENWPKLTNKPGFLLFLKVICLVFWNNTYCKYIFHVKIKLFVTFNSVQYPDPHGSALIWLPGSGSASALKTKAWS